MTDERCGLPYLARDAAGLIVGSIFILLILIGLASCFTNRWNESPEDLRVRRAIECVNGPKGEEGRCPSTRAIERGE